MHSVNPYEFEIVRNNNNKTMQSCYLCNPGNYQNDLTTLLLKRQVTDLVKYCSF